MRIKIFMTFTLVLPILAMYCTVLVHSLHRVFSVLSIQKEPKNTFFFCFDNHMAMTYHTKGERFLQQYHSII